MNLLIDIGNTRIKWVYSMSALLGSPYSLAYGSSSLDSIISEMDLHIAKVACVYRSCVATQVFTDSFMYVLYELLGSSIYKVQTLNNTFGLSVCYDEVASFGVDRWLAMLGAYGKFKSAFLVADLGSAVTIDFVSQKGKHLGGTISPGIIKMYSSLASCSGLPLFEFNDIAEYSENGFCCNTQDAIRTGVTLSVSSLLNHKAKLANKMLDNALELILTGGDAELVRPLLTDNWIIEPTLMFEGMLLLSRDNKTLTKIH